MTPGSGFRRKEGGDGGINREKWAGRRDLRTLLWTLIAPQVACGLTWCSSIESGSINPSKSMYGILLVNVVSHLTCDHYDVQ